MYRIDRHDVMTDVPVFADVDEQLRYCETHLLRINCREGTFELTPDGHRMVALEDIATQDMGVSFETGWYPVERWHGEVYRWAGQDAVLTVPVPSGPSKVLCLEVEPGPGVRSGPFELRVHNTGGQIVARGRVECRQLIYLSMPLPAGQTVRLRFHAVGGGTPIAFDPRLLNFRVMKFCWAEQDPPLMHWVSEDPSLGLRVSVSTTPTRSPSELEYLPTTAPILTQSVSEEESLPETDEACPEILHFCAGCLRPGKGRHRHAGDGSSLRARVARL